MDTVLKAERFAKDRHAGQTRPNKAQEPKIIHLTEVASLAKHAGCENNAIAAAWLHDIIEDTETSIGDIVSLFGNDISVLVDGLTDPADFKYLPLVARKNRQAERLETKDTSVKIIKLCDQISNVRSVVNDPPIDWDTEKCLNYVEGAAKIAAISYGLSPKLDAQFEEIYLEGITKYKN